MPQFKDFPPVDVGQLEIGLTYDFGRFLPATVILTGTPVITVTTVSGVDPSPQDIIQGSPAIVTPVNEPANTGVGFNVKGLVPAKYALTITCSRSDGGVATGDNFLTVRAAV